jgi:hypothetical protein
MRIFYKEEPEVVAKSKELSERLKKVDPKTDEAAVKKIDEKILAKHLELEKALKLRDSRQAYQLRFDLERLYGEQTDTKQRSWKEKNSIIQELTEINFKVVENSCSWLMKEIKELDFSLAIEEVEKIHNVATLEYRYKTKNNFAEVRKIQGQLLTAKTRIQKLLGSGSIAEIEQIYLDALSIIPSKIPCTEEKEVDEAGYEELRGNIPSTLDRSSDWQTYITMQRYISK